MVLKILIVYYISIASSRLHISVLPDKMPCREKETECIKDYLEQALIKGGRNKPLYISGLPGKTYIKSLMN